MLNLSDLTEAKSLLNTDAFQEMKSIWVDAAGDDTEALSLSLIEATDRFIRQAGLSKARQQALTVCVRQAALEPVAEHVLTTRFSTIRYGVEAADFLSDGIQAKTKALGEIRCNPTVHAHNVKLRKFDSWASKIAATALGQISDASAVPALLDALKDSDYRVRERAAAALKKIRH